MGPGSNDEHSSPIWRRATSDYCRVARPHAESALCSCLPPRGTRTPDPGRRRAQGATTNPTPDRDSRRPVQPTRTTGQAAGRFASSDAIDPGPEGLTSYGTDECIGAGTTGGTTRGRVSPLMRCTTLKASAGDLDGLLTYHALIHSPVDLTIAQVATDSATATLGIVNLVPGESGVPRSAIDQAVRSHVAGHHKLEAFSTFWVADDAVLFAPPRGCSPPTFRGSSADAMAIASTAISLIGAAAAAKLQGSFRWQGRAASSSPAPPDKLTASLSGAVTSQLGTFLAPVMSRSLSPMRPEQRPPMRSSLRPQHRADST